VQLAGTIVKELLYIIKSKNDIRVGDTVFVEKGRLSLK
jgi:hypothetical protein